ncbi:MAG: hypothetical protein HY040_12740 [Planctomycetes bacterium]|nr:hypothetical protein [Planctomycetota bacterium]
MYSKPFTSVLIAGLIAGGSSSALSQTPQFAQAPKVDDLLSGWEKALSNLQSLSMECKRTTKDRVFETTEEYRGSAKLLRPAQAKRGIRASLELFKVVGGRVQPDRFEKYLFSGSALYEYSAANKVIRKHAVGQLKAGDRDAGVLSLMFGKSAADVAKRYRLSLEPAKDAYYFLVKVEPKEEQDKADFRVAYVALYRSNLLTAMVELQQPNGNVVRWEFSKIEPNAALDERAFAPPEPPPAGWQLERIPNLKTP